MGLVSEASTPTIVNGMEPSTRRQRQPLSQITPSGTTSWRHTAESSSAVRVIEKKSPVIPHEGLGELIGNLQTANAPATPSSLSRGLAKAQLDSSWFESFTRGAVGIGGLSA
jgi:hypothetical protein